MHYGKIKLSSGEEVLFEIDHDYYGDASHRKDFIIQFESIMKSIKDIAENAYISMRNISEDARPDSYEISFGMKFSADAGVVFARLGSEGNFLVKLTWMAKK
jgi:hypothetical protein